ncbi:hypothetical protein K1719_004365 [Acacia pycnantha]|nr:hypothetical protein K1719_004365 [Acacia pycnantha]
MAAKNGHPAPPPRPTITLPPRPSMDAFFTGGLGLSPGPMTLVSSFFSDTYRDSDCCSFSQLLAGAMASPLALGARPSFLPDNSTTSEDGAKKNLGFKQSRPMNLVVARSPLFTIPPGLSPSGLLNSPGFFSPQSPFGMSHQQALAQVTAQAVLAQSQMHVPADFHPSLVTAPSEPLAVQPSSTPGQGSEMQLPSVLEPKGALVEIPEISQADNKYQTSSMGVDKPADDGYNWRKYGQKQVKGSEYPRGYYKCTYLNCPVKKKIERAIDGHITEIIYKGQHDHEKPQPNRRAAKDNCESNEDKSIQVMPESNTQGRVRNSNVLGESTPYHSMPESDLTSNQEAPKQSSGSRESEEALDANITEEDGDVGEPNPKRRSTEAGASEASISHNTVTEPKIIVQTRSGVDLLDDGYRWRKYGQKVVKGNPHPRSYYKCTSAGCNVRKHVERSSTDPKAVITKYEGKHNHDVPASRNGSHTTATTNSMPLKPHRVTPGKHPLLRDMDFGNNDQRPTVLRFKEEQKGV